VSAGSRSGPPAAVTHGGSSCRPWKAQWLEVMRMGESS
jgi:hypothetical protein